MKKTLLMVVGAALLALASTNNAKADVITLIPTGSPTIAGGVATWTYDVQLSFEQLQPTGVQFGTLYGFNFGSQAVAVSNVTGLLAADFNFAITPSTSRAVSAPPALGQGPNDANGIVAVGAYDIRYTFNNSTTLGTFAGNTDLGTFTVKSSFLTSGLSEYDGTAYSNVGLGGNSHPILVAVATPEPMSLALLGGGLAFLGIARLRRKI